MGARGPRAMILGVADTELWPTERSFLRDADPWGFILFARNIESPDQLRRLVGELRATVGREAPILIDQEGGRVQRLGPPHWRQWSNALEWLGRFPRELRARAMRLRYALIGSELAALGIDTDCAPMADLALPETHPAIRERCYADTPDEVTELARACALGLSDAGVLPVLKHIPGHGRTGLDSHRELPVVDRPLTRLEDEDFAPFRALNTLPMAMTAHIVYPALDPDAPVTFSAKAMTYIRREIGFSGLIMTDDLNMSALTGSLTDRMRRSFAAGCDIALHCNGHLGEMLVVAQEAPRLEGEGLARADAEIAARRKGASLDTGALGAALDALEQEASHA